MTSARAMFARHSPLLAAGLLVCVLSLPGQPLSAQADKCAFVKAADVTALLGGPPVPTKQGSSCAWKVAGSNRKLMVLVYSNQIPGAMAFSRARQQAGSDGDAKVRDEAGIGDKAFSLTASFGASFMDRDLLRIVVRKAVAAF